MKNDVQRRDRREELGDLSSGCTFADFYAQRHWTFETPLSDRLSDHDRHRLQKPTVPRDFFVFLVMFVVQKKGPQPHRRGTVGAVREPPLQRWPFSSGGVSPAHGDFVADPDFTNRQDKPLAAAAESGMG